MITIENADKALKDYYLEAVTAQLNGNISPFFTAIEKSAANVYGKDVNITVVREGNGSVIACAEDADLPGPYQNRYLSIKMPLKNLYGTIEISDKALRASRETSGAFISLVNAEMEGLIMNAKQNFQRMLFSNGSGKMCTVTERVTQAVYKVDNVKDFYVGMQVDVFPVSGSVLGDSIGITVAAIDKDASTVTFTDEVFDQIVNGTMYLHGSKDTELTGLGAIFDNQTLYGYDKTAEPYFAPYKVDAEKTITEEKLTDVLDYLEEHYNSRINMILCSYKTRKRIAALIADNRRVVNSTDAHTGFGVVTVNDVPVYADKYCTDDRILFLNTDDFVLSQLCDWEWLEDESGKILKQVPGKAAYGATLVKYAELICKKPCGQAMLFNI